MNSPRRETSSFAAQLLHQLRFDITRIRWSVFAFAAALYVTLLISSTSGLEPTEGLSYMVPLLVSVTAAVAMVASTQSDWPFSDRDFRVGKPVATAVLACSKLLLLVMLWMTPLVSAAVYLGVLGMPAKEVLSLLERPALLLACLLATAMGLGVLTRNLRTAILGALLLPLSVVLIDRLVGVKAAAFFARSGIASVAPTFVSVTLVGGAAALLFAAYSRRLSRGAASVLALGGFSVSLAVSSNAPSMARRDVSLPVLSSVPESISLTQVGEDRVAQDDGWPFQIRVDGMQPEARYQLRNVLVHVRYTHGPDTHSALSSPTDPGHVMRYFEAPAGAGSTVMALPVPIGVDRQRAIRAVELNAELIRLTARRLPLVDSTIRLFGSKTSSLVRLRWSLADGVHLASWSQLDCDTDMPVDVAFDGSEKQLEFVVRRQRGASPERFFSQPMTRWAGAWLLIGIERRGWVGALQPMASPTPQASRRAYIPAGAVIDVFEVVPIGRINVHGAYQLDSARTLATREDS